MVECDDVERARPTCCSRRTCRSRRTRCSTSASSSSRSGALVVVPVFFANLVDRQAGEDLRGLAAAGGLRRGDGGDHRRDHAGARRGDLHPDLPLVARADATVDPQVYRMVWWALGHSSQQINVAAMVAIWYMLGALTVGAVVLNEKISRSAFVLYILFISMASAHHLLVDPGHRAGVEDREHQLLHVHGGARLDDPRLHRAGRHGARHAAARLHRRACSTGCAARRGAIRASARWCFSVVVFGFVGGITGVTHRHRADQHHRAQHAARSRALPRHGGERHGDGVHGRHLLPDSADLPAEGGVLEAGAGSSRTSSPAAC